MNPGRGVIGLGGGGVGVLALADSFCGGGPNFVFDGVRNGSGVFALGGDGGAGALDISLVMGFVGLTCLGVDGGRCSRSESCLLEA